MNYSSVCDWQPLFPGDGLRIVPYGPEHATAFRDLNLAWIRKHFVVEERDTRDLGEPERYILAPGGYIFMAELRDDVVGTCALMLESDGVFELAKMTVAESARGLGVGRALGDAALAHARAIGARRVELWTNSSLAPAIALYHSLGFVDAPLGATEFVRANVHMVLEL
ncbi:MAG: GNAT family N-acetyltransferase [Gemmatimonadales bacterium]